MAEEEKWYNGSSGNLLLDLGLYAGAEQLSDLYSKGTSSLFNPLRTSSRGFFAGASGSAARGMNAVFGTNALMARLASSPRTAPYVAGNALNTFGLLRDSYSNVRLSGGKGALVQRNGFSTLASRVGSKRAAAGVLARAGVAMGVRAAFTAQIFGFGTALGKGIGDIVSNYEKVRKNDLTVHTGGVFADTRTSYTQRQASLQAIHNSQLSSRAALGGEAAIMMGMNG